MSETMATYLNDLDWRSHPEDFDPNERKILLALSNERWDWLTVGALRKSANLREQKFEDALVSLMRDRLVRGGRSEDWQAILGLAERVGMGARPIRVRRKAIKN